MELRICEIDKGEGEAALRHAQGPNFRVTKVRVKQPFGRLRDRGSPSVWSSELVELAVKLRDQI